MKIALANLKFAHNLSQETTAYTATVTIDGIRAFTARNDGHGGADLFYPLPGYAGPSVAEVNAWLAGHVAPEGPFETDPDARQPWDTGTPCDLEVLVGRLLSLSDAKAQLKRKLARKVVTMARNGAIYAYGGPPTPARIAAIAAAKPDETIINAADAPTMDRAVRLFAAQPDHEEAVYERQRANQLTLADANWLLAQDRAGEKPCPDLQEHLQQVIATVEARCEAYHQSRPAAASG